MIEGLFVGSGSCSDFWRGTKVRLFRRRENLQIVFIGYILTIGRINFDQRAEPRYAFTHPKRGSCSGKRVEHSLVRPGTESDAALNKALM